MKLRHTEVCSKPNQRFQQKELSQLVQPTPNIYKNELSSVQTQQHTVILDYYCVTL